MPTNPVVHPAVLRRIAQQNPNAEPTEEDDRRIMRDIAAKAGHATISGVSAAANVLDLPRSMVADLATWVPGGIEGQNPFDQLLTPTSQENRTQPGEFYTKSLGYRAPGEVKGFKANARRFVEDVGLDILMDPLTYMTLGAGAVARLSGKGVIKAGMSTMVEDVASKKLGKKVGRREAWLRTTADDLVDVRYGDEALNPVEAAAAAEGRKKSLEVSGVTEWNKPLGRGPLDFKLPFTERFRVSPWLKRNGEAREGALRYAKGLDDTQEWLANTAIVRHTAPHFRKAMQGATNRVLQLAGIRATKELDDMTAMMRTEMTPHFQNIEESGVFQKVGPVSHGPLPNEMRVAADLLSSIGQGSVPTFITANLRNIARNLGIDITGDMNAGNVVDAVRSKYDQHMATRPSAGADLTTEQLTARRRLATRFLEDQGRRRQFGYEWFTEGEGGEAVAKRRKVEFNEDGSFKRVLGEGENPNQRFFDTDDEFMGLDEFAEIRPILEDLRQMKEKVGKYFDSQAKSGAQVAELDDLTTSYWPRVLSREGDLMRMKGQRSVLDVSDPHAMSREDHLEYIEGGTAKLNELASENKYAAYLDKEQLNGKHFTTEEVRALKDDFFEGSDETEGSWRLFAGHQGEAAYNNEAIHKAMKAQSDKVFDLIAHRSHKDWKDGRDLFFSDPASVLVKRAQSSARSTVNSWNMAKVLGLNATRDEFARSGAERQRFLDEVTEVYGADAHGLVAMHDSVAQEWANAVTRRDPLNPRDPDDYFRLLQMRGADEVPADFAAQNPEALFMQQAEAAMRGDRYLKVNKALEKWGKSKSRVNPAEFHEQIVNQGITNEEYDDLMLAALFHGRDHVSKGDVEDWIKTHQVKVHHTSVNAEKNIVPNRADLADRGWRVVRKAYGNQPGKPPRFRFEPQIIPSKHGIPDRFPIDPMVRSMERRLIDSTPAEEMANQAYRQRALEEGWDVDRMANEGPIDLADDYGTEHGGRNFYETANEDVYATTRDYQAGAHDPNFRGGPDPQEVDFGDARGDRRSPGARPRAFGLPSEQIGNAGAPDLPPHLEEIYTEEGWQQHHADLMAAREMHERRRQLGDRPVGDGGVQQTPEQVEFESASRELKFIDNRGKELQDKIANPVDENERAASIAELNDLRAAREGVVATLNRHRMPGPGEFDPERAARVKQDMQVKAAGPLGTRTTATDQGLQRNIKPFEVQFFEGEYGQRLAARYEEADNITRLSVPAPIASRMQGLMKDFNVSNIDVLQARNELGQMIKAVETGAMPHGAPPSEAAIKYLSDPLVKKIAKTSKEVMALARDKDANKYADVIRAGNDLIEDMYRGLAIRKKATEAAETARKLEIERFAKQQRAIDFPGLSANKVVDTEQSLLAAAKPMTRSGASHGTEEMIGGSNMGEMLIQTYDGQRHALLKGEIPYHLEKISDAKSKGLDGVVVHHEKQLENVREEIAHIEKYTVDYIDPDGNVGVIARFNHYDVIDDDDQLALYIPKMDSPTHNAGAKGGYVDRQEVEQIHELRRLVDRDDKVMEHVNKRFFGEEAGGGTASHMAKASSRRVKAAQHYLKVLEDAGLDEHSVSVQEFLGRNIAGLNTISAATAVAKRQRIDGQLRLVREIKTRMKDIQNRRKAGGKESPIPDELIDALELSEAEVGELAKARKLLEDKQFREAVDSFTAAQSVQARHSLDEALDDSVQTARITEAEVKAQEMAALEGTLNSDSARIISARAKQDQVIKDQLDEVDQWIVMARQEGDEDALFRGLVRKQYILEDFGTMRMADLKRMQAQWSPRGSATGSSMEALGETSRLKAIEVLRGRNIDIEFNKERGRLRGMIDDARKGNQPERVKQLQAQYDDLKQQRKMLPGADIRTGYHDAQHALDELLRKLDTDRLGVNLEMEDMSAGVIRQGQTPIDPNKWWDDLQHGDENARQIFNKLPQAQKKAINDARKELHEANVADEAWRDAKQSISELEPINKGTRDTIVNDSGDEAVPRAVDWYNGNHQQVAERQLQWEKMEQDPATYRKAPSMVPRGHVRLYRVGPRPGEGAARRKVESPDWVDDPNVPEWLRDRVNKTYDPGVADWVASTPEFQATKEAEGRWFGLDVNQAAGYARENPGWDMVHVDIPIEQAKQFRVDNLAKKKGGKGAKENPGAFVHTKGDPATEYFLPREMAMRARRSAAPVTDTPLKESWHHYGMRTALEHAARNGYAKVVVGTGDETLRRARANSLIRSVAWKRELGGDAAESTWKGKATVVTIEPKQAGEAPLTLTVTPAGRVTRISRPSAAGDVGDDIGKFVGSKTRDRIMGENKGAIAGNDLFEGVNTDKKLYGTDIPEFVEAWGKDYGLKVEPVISGKAQMRRQLSDALDEMDRLKAQASVEVPGTKSHRQLLEDADKWQRRAQGYRELAKRMQEKVDLPLEKDGSGKVINTLADREGAKQAAAELELEAARLTHGADKARDLAKATPETAIEKQTEEIRKLREQMNLHWSSDQQVANYKNARHWAKAQRTRSQQADFTAHDAKHYQEQVEQANAKPMLNESVPDRYEIEITPQLRHKVLSGQPLYRESGDKLDPLFRTEGGEIKGAMVHRFDPTEEEYVSTMYAFGAPDPKTFVHESGHVFRKWLKYIDPELERRALKDMEDTYGLVPAADGSWTRDMEEKFAEVWTEFHEKGALPPKKGLAKMVQKFKDWAVDLYKRLSGNENFHISEEMRSVFHDMLGGEASMYRGPRTNLLEVMKGVNYNSPMAKLNIMAFLRKADRGKLRAGLREQLRGADGSLPDDVDDLVEGMMPDFAEYTSSTSPYGGSMDQLKEQMKERWAHVLGDDWEPGIERMLGSMTIDRDVADDLLQAFNAVSEPKGVAKLLGILDAYTNAFKTGVTAMFPGFHIRNYYSGWLQNAIHGVHDPRYQHNMFKRYTAHYKDMRQMMYGEEIGEATQIPWIAQMRRRVDNPDGSFTERPLTNAEATDEMRALMFAHGLMDSPGMINDLIADLGEDAITQIMGLRKTSTGSKIPGKELFNWVADRAAAPPGTRWSDALKFWKTKGVASTADEFAWARWGRALGDSIEAQHRGGGFIALMRQGYSPAEAARRVKTLQLDYSNLSRTERDVMRRIMPFYSFTRQMLAQVGEELTTNPGGPMANLIRSSNRATTNDPGAPDYVKQGLAIPMGRLPDGSQRYFAGIGLMHEQPLNLFQPDIQGMLFNAGSQTHPLFKTGVELAFDESMFQSGPHGGRSLDDMDPLVGRIGSNLSQTLGMMRNGDYKGLVMGRTTERRQPWQTNKVFEAFAGGSPAARALATVRVGLDPRKNLFEKVMATFSGARVRDVPVAAQDAIQREQVQKLLREMGANEFVRLYIPEDLKASMSPEQLRATNEYMAALRVFRGRQKQRKAAEEAAQSGARPGLG